MVIFNWICNDKKSWLTKDLNISYGSSSKKYLLAKHTIIKRKVKDHVKYTILLKYTILAQVYDLDWKYTIIGG